MKRTLAVSLALGIALSVFGQAQAAKPDSTGPYVITAVEFEIDGVTRDFILDDKADIEIGKRFSDIESLEAYLADKRQVLINERVLEDAAIRYELRESAEGEKEVLIHVWVKDSWNIIALPYFRYDSNSGLLLSIRGRDYNFLGSMQTLTLNLDYRYDELGRSGFGGYTKFAVPFVLGDFLFSLGLSEDLLIYADGTPTFNAASLGLSATYREFGFPLTASLSQALSTNPDGVADDSDPYYMTSSLGLSASFESGWELADRGPLVYTPSVTLAQIWRFEAPVRDDREGLTMTFVNALAWGRADWFGNLRRGLSASLSNTLAYNLAFSSWGVDFDAGLNAFATYAGRIGLMARGQAFYRPVGGAREDIGENTRGILNARMDGDAGLFLNFDLPVKLFDFPTHLVIGKDWLDFELQASPFIDAALVRPSAAAAVGADDLWLAGGLEMLVYPLRMRTFIVRASLGFDLRNVLETKSLTADTPDGSDPYELFFGLGLLY